MKLTVRKQAWVNRFKPDILRGEPVNASVSSELRYYRKLANLINEMANDTEKELKAYFKEDHAEEYFAQDAGVASGLRIITNALQRKWNGLFLAKSKTLAEQAAEEADKNSTASVTRSVKKLTGGLSLGRFKPAGDIKQITKASIAENVSLIKSIPQQYHTAIQGAVMRSVTTGSGLQDLVPFLKNYRGITLRRARFIAMDQTRKINENLAIAKLLKLGITKGEWLHVASNHPRKTHLAMAGKVYNITEGLYDPDVKRKVKPAELPNCRCTTRPVLDFLNE